MENNFEELRQNLREHILQLNSIINKLGNNPYKEIDKILIIINQKNYKQFHSIRIKMKELSILIYDRRIYDEDVLILINNMELILNKFDNCI